MFGSITKHIKEKALRATIDKLATTGEAGLAGIGSIKYDYIHNTLAINPDPKVMEEIKKQWEQNHHGVPYEI